MRGPTSVSTPLPVSTTVCAAATSVPPPPRSICSPCGSQAQSCRLLCWLDCLVEFSFMCSPVTLTQFDFPNRKCGGGGFRMCPFCRKGEN